MLYILYGHGVNSSRIYAVNFEHFQYAKGDALAFARATMLVYFKRANLLFSKATNHRVHGITTTVRSSPLDDIQEFILIQWPAT
jgi:hypothetical protein